ncbi:DUF1176 domain-containing protein [Sphingomonas xinjiangensis]|uniref:DUF1176 domain-containing protein n=1 Tax=Sphingomonas xinjiangensis TaxID=643568 RepID=A0A840YQP1_9SPHN|nr:DUF1176 domain-containing protein [Sphingomonas xinjiangensis]MBB5711391.1 hypothetical protein [Sphingomonas xinjiangensis]
MLTYALLLAAAQAVPTPGTEKGFGDWEVACDNSRACEMTSLIPEEAEWPEDGPLNVSVAREAGPAAGFDVTIETGEMKGVVAVKIDGAEVVRNTPAKGGIRITGAEAARIVAAMANGTAMRIEHAGKLVMTVPLSGSAAALRFIEAEQGRAGTVTAAVAKGAKPASSVPAAIAAPQVAALRASGKPAAITKALKARMVKLAECDDAGESDPMEVSTAALGGGATLALLPCLSGAYNTLLVPFVVRGGTVAVADLDYSNEGSDTAPMLTNGWWEAERSVLSSRAKGRGIGDCGESAEYVWDGRRFRLIELRSMDPCRGSTNWLRRWTAKPVFR